jgi:hypothetical protein
MAGWTVVVWAAVTPDLEQAVAADLFEVGLAVEALRGGGDVHLEVVWTPSSSTAINNLRTAWTGTPPPERVTFLGDAADGSALRSKLQHETSSWNKPERKRMLVLWGHGFLGVRGDPTIAVPPAEEVVSAFAGAAGTGPTHPDIIGYDACRMATAPTVLTLAQGLPKAVFIGSMIPEPATGWPYSEVLRVLATDAAAEPVAAAIVQAYAASVDVPDWCLLALRLSALGARNGPLDKALKGLRKVKPPTPADFFAAASGADTLDDTDLVDLGALMRRLTDRTAFRTSRVSLHDAAAQVRAVIRSATIARRASGNLGGRDGISVQLLLPPLPPPPPPPAAPVGAGRAAQSWDAYLEPGVFR